MTTLSHAFRNRDNEERGFTLIELAVVVLVMGILSGISVPIYTEAKRNAIIATVKSDISSSIHIIPRQLDSTGYFVTDDYFADNAAITGDNNIVLMVDGAGQYQTACIWGSHIFSDDDIVSYHYSSETGKISEGGCLGVVPTGSTVIVGTGPGTSDPTVQEPTPASTPSAAPNTGAAPSSGSGSTTNEPSTSTTTPPPSSGTQTGTLPASGTQPTVQPQPAEPTYSSTKNKYPVCHGSGTKWNLLMLPYAGLINGHAGHPDDVIPPISGKYAGHNWDAKGWEIFRKYCS